MIRYENGRWLSEKNLDDQGMPSTNLSGDLEMCWCKERRVSWYSKLGSNFGLVPTLFKPIISAAELMANPYIFEQMCRAIEPVE